MKIHKINLFLFLLIAGTMLNCTDGFEELNTNPFDPVDVPTSYLLTQAERASMPRGDIDGVPIATSMFYASNLYAQLMAETQYTEVSRYDTEELNFLGFYTGPLADLQQIINLNTDPETAESSEVVSSGASVNQLAVARILKVYNFQIVTDTWGDIPYFEALQFEKGFIPKYDKQEDIYADFVKELTEASAQIDVNAEGVVGDQIYEGDMAMWKKFANSLLLRVGIRMSEANPGLAQQAITTAVANGVFASADDGALYPYLADAANANPIYYHFNIDNRTDYAISNVLEEYLNSVNDPRLGIYGEPTGNSVEVGAPVVKGMPYGLSNALAGGITNGTISFPGEYWKDNPATKGIIMSYSEVQFILAEAAARGWISGDAATYYNQAITASMNYYDITDQSAINAYLAQPKVAYDAANFKKSIGTQKWISLYTVLGEPWSEWRRLGFPELAPAPNATVNRPIPFRRAYPQSEFELNQANFQAGVSQQLGKTADNTTVSDPVWWDK